MEKEYLQQIHAYIPYDEQEEKDKQIMLEYVKQFPDCLTRENKIGHFSSSSFVVNQKRDHVLFVYHNIYNSWTWTGGHVDGETDFLQVAIRETKEETGVKTVLPIVESIFAVDVLPVCGHRKKGEYVSSHMHLNVTYLLEADEKEQVRIKEDENKGVKWILIEKIKEYSTEKDMYYVYDKLVNKLRQIEKENQ